MPRSPTFSVAGLHQHGSFQFLQRPVQAFLFTNLNSLFSCVRHVQKSSSSIEILSLSLSLLLPVFLVFQTFYNTVSNSLVFKYLNIHLNIHLWYMKQLLIWIYVILHMQAVIKSVNCTHFIPQLHRLRRELQLSRHQCSCHFRQDKFLINKPTVLLDVYPEVYKTKSSEAGTWTIKMAIWRVFWGV